MVNLIDILLDDFEKRFLECENSKEPFSALDYMETQNEFMAVAVDLFGDLSQLMFQDDDLIKKLLGVHGISERIAGSSEFSKKIEYLDDNEVDLSSVSSSQRTLIDYHNIINTVRNFEVVVNCSNNSLFENAFVYRKGNCTLKFKFSEYNYSTGEVFVLPLICGNNISIFPRSPVTHSPQ